MRTLEKNKQDLYYLLFNEKIPIVDGEGHKTSEYRIVYKPAVKTKFSISAAKGKSETEIFGKQIVYDRVIAHSDMKCPINENTVLFIDKLPEYDADGNPLYDYEVAGIAKSLNGYLIAVKKRA